MSKKDAVVYRPFILARVSDKSFTETVSDVQDLLKQAGFEVVGTYAPRTTQMIFCVTNDEIKRIASRTPHGAYGAVQRVAVAETHESVHVTFTNPRYMACAYRMEGEMEAIFELFSKTLGFEKDFGSKKGKKPEKLRKYQYTMGMPNFTEPSTLATFPSHTEAVDAVEEGLASTLGGVSKIYRVDVPDTEECVFGVKMAGAKLANDLNIMNYVDGGDISFCAHLPYEIVVTGGRVHALSAKFRIAISFPDLKMVGPKPSFAGIMDCPDQIKKALTAVCRTP